jgi:uncharacterized protein (TIGR02145 family)
MLQLPLNTIDSITYTISNPGNLATLTTLPIGNITTSGATSGGNITNNGGSTITSRGICWAISSNPTPADNYSVNGSGIGSFVSNLSGLTPNTIYYVRAYAINSAGTSYGNEVSLSITYDESKIPAVTTLPVDNFGPFNLSARLNGEVDSEGGSTVIERGFCWDTIPNVDINSNKSSAGAGTGNFSRFIEDLVRGNKSYYVRAYAINSYGTSYGDAVHFSTDPFTPLILTTQSISSITDRTAVSGGNITDDGGRTVTSRGVCWGTSSSPTIADSVTVNGNGIGSFTSNLIGLKAGTKYYVRAYAVYSAGIFYGNEVSFIRTNTDADGNVYTSVTIGTQEWMVENLRTTKYSDGTAILNVTNGSEWSDLETGAWSHYSNYNQYEAMYGKLYNWYAVETGKLCPTGWHVPTDSEWTVLTDYLSANGHGGKEGKALKATSGWNDNEGWNGTDDYGWLGLPAGLRKGKNGVFEKVGNYGHWWSSSENNTNNWLFYLKYHNDAAFKGSGSKEAGFSVRCLRD